MKCVGVLGGYGPLATAHFFRQLITLTPASKDWEHLHIIVNNNPKVPSRARAFLYGEQDPTLKMIEEIERLRSAGAEFFVCPCNSAHYFLRKLPTTPLPFIDMVEVTISRLKEAGFRRSLLLGSEVTMRGGTYADLAAANGLCIDPYPDASRVRAIIEAGKTGANLVEASESLVGILKDATSRYDSAIFACTELPLVVNPSNMIMPVIDTSQVLAEETVRYALK